MSEIITNSVDLSKLTLEPNSILILRSDESRTPAELRTLADHITKECPDWGGVMLVISTTESFESISAEQSYALYQSMKQIFEKNPESASESQS